MTHPDLTAHDAQFPKSVIKIADGIWSAVGFAASNVHMIEGQDSVTIIDTTESTKAAENILAEFRKLTNKPIGRIIYTHSHRDHISGATVFCEGREIPILASALFSSDLIGTDATAIAPNKSLGRRTQAQFGIGLTPQERVSLGCGPGERPLEGLGAGFIAPTEFVVEDKDIDLDGVTARLIHAPGETADHLCVWLPDSSTLFCGDNWYHAFPNLYAIRGTPYRDYAAWAESLGLLANLEPQALCPGHTLPVKGAEKVQEVLSSTRAAIVHVMQYTANGMDAMWSSDDIAANISLPDELADKPWLKEYYGKIGWSARAFAVGTLGWYDGNPTNLGTLSSKRRAEHIAALAGGAGALVEAAKKTDDLQWRMELCDHAISLGEPAEGLKAETMTELADLEINATARNTYLWEAKQLLAKAGGQQ